MTYVLRNTSYSYAPINGTPYVLVVVTPADLWLVAPPTMSPEQPHVFTQFSSLGGRGQPYLQRVEGRGRGSHLTVVTGDMHDSREEVNVLSAGMCANESASLLSPLLSMASHTVGVVGTTLLPGATDDLLTDVLLEEGWSEGEGEVYLVDDTATIITAAPFGQVTLCMCDQLAQERQEANHTPISPRRAGSLLSILICSYSLYPWEHISLVVSMATS